ncbi:hypothetical protein F4808DRAFT_67044 [Astrocystis sublimbata]|nr:hypothetical protein F4808DRAFT_67044 [Astrocystis sublimbata]
MPDRARKRGIKTTGGGTFERAERKERPLQLLVAGFMFIYTTSWLGSVSGSEFISWEKLLHGILVARKEKASASLCLSYREDRHRIGVSQAPPKSIRVTIGNQFGKTKQHQKTHDILIVHEICRKRREGSVCRLDTMNLLFVHSRVFLAIAGGTRNIGCLRHDSGCNGR